MAQGRRYRILSVLGQGGFGTVYRARLLGEGGFSKAVALKVLNPELSGKAELARRLRDEARVLGLVQHRAIVKVDALVQLDGRWTVVMEYVEGRDLKTILEQGPIPLGPALEIAAEVASALHTAWNAVGPDDTPLRLLHRDIKPANICVTALGEVKVLDFGIARAEFGDRESSTQSQAYGTPDYMAPERFLFDNGPEADLYAVGATLYEMLLGQQLGRASPRERLHGELIEGRLQVLADTLGPDHADVIELLGELLAWQPERRPAARELERRLARLRHAKEGPLLRDWAEGALPRLVAAQESRVDGATGTMLVEGGPASEALSPTRPSWPSQAPEAATFALARTPNAGATLVAEVEPEPRPLAPPAPSPPEAAPPARTPARLLAAAAVLALGVGAIWWVRAGPAAPPPSAPTAAPEPAAPEPAAPLTTPTAPETPPAVSAPAAPVTAPATSAPAAPSPTGARRTASPAPAAAPAAAPAPPETSPSAAPADGPSGRWEGSMNGMPLDLVLDASGDVLSGEVVVSFGPSAVRSRVRGSWDPASRTLQLEDVEQTEDSGSYTGTLSADGARMSGSFHASAGGTIVRFTAKRSGS